jgi:Ni,Fe-hydrogenase III small subunit
LPARYRGRPQVHKEAPSELAAQCAAVCPQEAIDAERKLIDLGRFGINFVVSPRHADGIVVTGPVSRNMKTALLQTYEATPAPKVVIAVGSCALSGGSFRGSAEITEGLDRLLPVDLYIPGCPPHPLTNLHALLTYFKVES